MKACDFIRKAHVSCNGCYFQNLHRITCIDKSNEKLIGELFFRLGKCFDGHNNSIYILKEGNIDTNRYKHSKPKKKESLPEEVKIFKPHLIFEERYQRIAT